VGATAKEHKEQRPRDNGTKTQTREVDTQNSVGEIFVGTSNTEGGVWRENTSKETRQKEKRCQAEGSTHKVKQKEARGRRMRGWEESSRKKGVKTRNRAD